MEIGRDLEKVRKKREPASHPLLAMCALSMVSSKAIVDVASKLLFESSHTSRSVLENDRHTRM